MEHKSNTSTDEKQYVNLNDRLRHKVIEGKLDRINKYQDVINFLVKFLEGEAKKCKYGCNIPKHSLDGWSEDDSDMYKAIDDYFTNEMVYVVEYDNHLHFSWERANRYMS